MKKRALLISLCMIIAITLSSWGDIGHSMISLKINLSFNEEMTEFNDWVFYLSEHASDADWRKKDDPEESPKHYIDIDNYDSFIASGKIPQRLDSCIEVYGADFVGDNGYLPWATFTMYDSLVSCLKRKDWTQAKKYAADLGHYVADGHMPMHITKNYDGQFSGNKGIHYRYEIGMIDRYHDQIDYPGSPAQKIENVEDYVFTYIYDNYKYVDSILIADDYAQEINSNTESDTYYAALWERTENITNVLFERASHAFAELIYNAWLEAGKPSSSTLSIRSENLPDFNISVFPNPASDCTLINYTLHKQESISAAIYDSSGKIHANFQNLSEFPGMHSIKWETNAVKAGAYYFVLENNSITNSKIILVN